MEVTNLSADVPLVLTSATASVIAQSPVQAARELVEIFLPWML
jgi:hypothetical protein